MPGNQENADGSVYRVLALNPGSTSTKLAVFENEQERAQENIAHAVEDFRACSGVVEQADLRLRLIRAFLDGHGLAALPFHAVIGRGGLLKPLPGGVYAVGQSMLADLRSCRFGEHASNLGGILAHLLAQELHCSAYIADPVVVDELDEICRITGVPELERRSIFHALNQKSAARSVARRIGKAYENCRFIVAHMGGGISVGAHCAGRVVDVNNALDGEGPFAPERAGSLPAGQLAHLCFGGKFSPDQLKKKLVGGGGLVAHWGSNRFPDLKQAMAAGDARARLLFDAMVLRVSQEIARHGATLKGVVDRIILTGGLAGDPDFVGAIGERVGYLAQIEVIPGEREMIAMAQAALAALRGEIKVKEYQA